jgi:hypothetical protein
MTRARRTTVALVIIVAAVVAAAPALDARVRGGVYIAVGPFWWPPYPYGWYPGPYDVGYPRVIVVGPPPVYIQMPPAPPPTQYWYYCTPSQAYYPYMQSCAAPWIKVPASPQ